MFNEKLFWKWWYWFIFNPFRIMRKGILNGILDNSKYIKWNVLDFWCWEKSYKDLLKFNTYEWLDFYETCHDNRNNDIEIYWDWKHIPREDEAYDSLICTEVLEHIFNIDDVLSEIYRVLKIWWYWVITIPFIFWEHAIPYDFSRYTYFWIEDILKKHWFKIIKHERIWNTRTTLCQMKIQFVSSFFAKIRSKWVRRIFFSWFYMSFQVFFNMLSFIPCKDCTMYLNNLIVVEKR